MSNPWFRMYSDFIYNETVEFLSFEDQRHFVFLLCMKNEGILDKDYPQPGMLERVVGRRLGLIGEALDNARRRIMEVGLINGDWHPVNWDERQFKSDTSKERTRAYRDRLKRHSDVTVTPQESDTDTDTDTDTEEDKGDRNTDVLLFPNPEKKKKATPVPKDFEVTEEMFDWAVAQGVPELRIRPETEQFLDRNKANGSTYLDWNAAWRTWMRNSVKFAARAV